MNPDRYSGHDAKLDTVKSEIQKHLAAIQSRRQYPLAVTHADLIRSAQNLSQCLGDVATYLTDDMANDSTQMLSHANPSDANETHAQLFRLGREAAAGKPAPPSESDLDAEINRLTSKQSTSVMPLETK